MGRTDFSLWYADIQKAAGGKANTLKDQQLSRNDIPIIVDSCIAFITQYGKDIKSVHINVFEFIVYNHNYILSGTILSIRLM